MSLPSSLKHFILRRKLILCATMSDLSINKVLLSVHFLHLKPISLRITFNAVFFPLNSIEFGDLISFRMALTVGNVFLDTSILLIVRRITQRSKSSTTILSLRGFLNVFSPFDIDANLFSDRSGIPVSKEALATGLHRRTNNCPLSFSSLQIFTTFRAIALLSLLR